MSQNIYFSSSPKEIQYEHLYNSDSSLIKGQNIILPSGKSAYEIAVEKGFTGSVQEWLESLHGVSPHIGDNGNWFIGEQDTNISAITNQTYISLDDYATGVNDIKYTPVGTVTGDINSEPSQVLLTRDSYVPQGVVSGSVVPTGNINIQSDVKGFQIPGANKESQVTFFPVTTTVLKSIKTQATPPTFLEGKYIQGSFKKGNPVLAAKEGLVLSLDEDDPEMLVFSTAKTENVINYNAEYTPGKKEADIFSAGTNPDFNTAEVWISGTSAKAAPQEFIGGKIKATFEGNPSGDFINANFQGMVESDLKITNATYEKTKVSNLSFNGNEVTITPTLIKENKVITPSLIKEK